ARERVRGRQHPREHHLHRAGAERPDRPPRQGRPRGPLRGAGEAARAAGARRARLGVRGSLRLPRVGEGHVHHRRVHQLRWRVWNDSLISEGASPPFRTSPFRLRRQSRRSNFESLAPIGGEGRVRGRSDLRDHKGEMAMAGAATGEKVTLPYTGKEFLESLDDGREVWIYGERVKNITAHPAFQNCARMLARLYDALHDDHQRGTHVLTEPTEWGGFTHRSFRAPTTVDEQVAGRDEIAAWARLTYGWLGRSPDYKAAFLGTLGANAEFYAPYQDNARRWYRYSQERVP